ncbi:hypothetical protein DCAR_0625856 [Daucus carota subsp. sativus]|uniref:Glucan endo-1,3-beta-D-glucosidase n=1 Tax=Daucus carota subsp. sativus TaxID=79200 RepID=A0AAF0XGL6_DAUCS|nr:PREDICTED: glucan endo-1,3-beta-glucosidase, acidic-like [Daucus carota subsp. sativus]WOH06429.1 hypothetical protein DCAR_0625856 [Daucus carota subsp. sativus]
MSPKVTTLLLLLSSLFAFLQATSGAGPQDVGVCYGSFGNNQPSAQEAVPLAQSMKIRRMRLYSPDRNALQALRNSGIEVILGVPNDHLHWVASDQRNAHEWVQGNVIDYSNVNFRFIAVGNGITPFHSQNARFAQFLLPAMQNIRNALSAFGLQNRIRVSTAIDQSEVLAQSFPPSSGNFRPEVRQFIQPIIQFLVKTGNTPLLVNLHPYFSYIHNKQDIPLQINKGKGNRDARLDYALMRSSNMLVQDAWLRYTNAFDAMVDSVHSAMEKVGGNSLDIVVSEVGWPTAGGPAASNQNAETHNNNLIRHVRNSGTPKRPKKRIETYIFSMFDEDRKSEENLRHWGIFWNNKQAKYRINF